MDFFQKILSDYQNDITLLEATPVAGGCINSSYKLETNQGNFFLKWNASSQKEMIEADASALHSLEEKSPIRVPKPLTCTEEDDKCYLLMEWIEQGYVSQDFWGEFGEKLAAQHKVSAEQFGWPEDNFIGSLAQSNNKHNQWRTFFIEERLLPQIRLAENKNLIHIELSNAFEKLFKELESLIPDESPALLHGDLWSGNFLCDDKSHPVIFDPSIHFGHRETELAFTSLFGGFDNAFYESYKATFPLESGFENRIDIHNLYPLLVHLNLFGPSYLAGIKQTLKRFR